MAHFCKEQSSPKARIFLLVDLQEYLFRSRVGGQKKINKKSSENDQLTGHFQSFFFFFFFFFLISPEKNSNTSKVIQQSVLNLLNISSFSKKS